jgi:hypothetical protein
LQQSRLELAILSATALIDQRKLVRYHQLAHTATTSKYTPGVVQKTDKQHMQQLHCQHRREVDVAATENSTLLAQIFNESHFDQCSMQSCQHAAHLRICNPKCAPLQRWRGSCHSLLAGQSKLEQLGANCNNQPMHQQLEAVNRWKCLA